MATFSKQGFSQAYQIAMAQQAPRMYRDLQKARTLKEHLKEIADQASAQYRGQVEHLVEMGNTPDQADRTATEVVFHEMIQFPQEPGQPSRSNMSL